VIALWNYLATPLVFTEPSFETREIGPHEENGETWHRVQWHRHPDPPPGGQPHSQGCSVIGSDGRAVTNE
jgi:hypothetical protein